MVGTINLANNSTGSTLSLDTINGSTIGIPEFLLVDFSDLSMGFDKFRQDDDLKTLQIAVNLRASTQASRNSTRLPTILYLV